MTTDQQMAMLADRYTQRAEPYDALWSPIIRPVGERLVARLPLSSVTRSVIDVGTTISLNSESPISSFLAVAES